MDQITEIAPHLRGYGWAPGDYFSRCHVCDQQFIGDKRAISCHPCAVARHEDLTTLFTLTPAQQEALLKIAAYLDLDGVFADFDEGIRRLGFKPDPEYNKSSHEMDDAARLWKEGMYQVIQGTNFYETLPLMERAADLYRLFAPTDPIFVTASPKFGSTEDTYLTHPYFLGAAYAKRRWVEECLLPAAALPPGAPAGGQSLRIRIADRNFVCTTSSRKQEFMHRKHSPYQVLVDDREANCRVWAESGGIAILHTSAMSTYRLLVSLLDQIIAGAELQPSILRTDFPRSRQPKVDVAQLVAGL
ncbi:hypothetical protein CcrC1_gp282 [Caulobacter phage C1]|nr:hypothetical protein CcrC1_gp282 [Caulobacter phage C1]UTU08511.1 hypothetical protein CcrC2_gp283 [Caulobacter phage C2]UTU09026.1 hypothetical protein CcrJ4_gp277 [Caulobacter phage J4]UTU10144.1 hypothetical protein CcrRB23_gp282 [Caulobacter phage RB23]WGN97178.1 hypothetical protein [Bertelyvirus sp.]